MAGYIEDRWLNKTPDPVTGRRERTALWGTGKRYKVAGIPGVRSRSFDAAGDAKKWLSEAQADARRAEFVDPRDGDMLLTDYIQKHFWPGRTDKLTTYTSMESKVRRHIEGLPIGELPLRRIDAAALREWKKQLLARVDTSTAEVIWIHLSTILAAAVEDKRLLKNPCKVNRSVKPPKKTEKQARAWQRPTVDAIRAGLQARYRVAVDLGVGAGLRQGELLGLAAEDFDFDQGVIHVRRQLRATLQGAFYFTLPKGDKTRAVPLTPRLGDRVRAHIEAFPPVATTLPWSDPTPPTSELEARQRKPITVQLLLTSSQGNRIYYRTFNDRSWKPALQAAGLIHRIEPDTPEEIARQRQLRRYRWSDPREHGMHCLRHTYASVQLAERVDPVTLSVWMGHASPVITLERYAHFMPGSGAHGLAVMDSWFEPEAPSAPPNENLPGDSLGLELPREWLVGAQVSGIAAKGADMKIKYKETSRGGLAVNVIEC
ncbi:tyrosine-type recombinase/integrase [Kitasatospora purpeofusca]|uniref:tyrosine-type recombinase/integrase n=1 Tax=Kitasatospora purpeofusca TaxID=67352 RepID=UPI00367DC56C